MPFLKYIGFYLRDVAKRNKELVTHIYNEHQEFKDTSDIHFQPWTQPMIKAWYGKSPLHYGETIEIAVSINCPDPQNM